MIRLRFFVQGEDSGAAGRGGEQAGRPRWGTHYVVHEDGEFESEFYSEAGETFGHTFEAAGDYESYCDPQRCSGMVGVAEG